jgi:hypothetical protein
VTYRNNNRKAERASMIGTVWILIALVIVSIVVAELYRSGHLSNTAGTPPPTGSVVNSESTAGSHTPNTGRR